ncbi:MAG TPA: nucleotidyltransferase family protein [Candidatus Polarisedimenticolaceae bacterium]|nr:nucleotidyltransferase family protein [Candidatus Polarisedimenticolaceae bacterium]
MSDRREALALLAVLRERWDEVDPALRPAVFVALAREADVAPAVHALLVSASRLGDAAAQLAPIRAKTRVDNLLLLARLEQALDLLAARGIRPIALKGVDVLPRLYASFDERTLDDIDLLVRRDERDAAFAALTDAGWALPPEPERTHWLKSSFEMPLTAPGPVGVALEIHWSLGQDVRYRIDDEGLFARAIAHEIDGRKVLRLDEHDAVAHLLLHHVQHYFDRRLKWVIELGRRAATPGFSWTTVAERLRAWGGLGGAGLALAHVRKLFPDLLPEAAFVAVPADAWRLALTLPLRSGHPLDFYRGTRRRNVQLLIAAACLERPRDLPGYLRHRAVRNR